MKLRCEQILWSILKKIGPITLTREDFDDVMSDPSSCVIHRDSAGRNNSIEFSARIDLHLEDKKPVKTLEDWGDERGKSECHKDGT